MRKKKILKTLAIFVGALIILFCINFIPTLRLKTNGMRVLQGDWIDVFYEQEEEAARDVFLLAEEKAEELIKILGFKEKQNVRIYIYDNQGVMQTKKYGYLSSLLRLDWYIGDNKGTSIILTSPSNPGREHSYNSVKEAVLHEMVHGYVSILNPNLDLWLKEGIALYLTNGSPFYKEYLNYNEIPSFDKIGTKNPITFANFGGYNLAHTYIEYIEVTYGWDTVLELIRTKDYKGSLNKTLNKTQGEFYEEWKEYIVNYPK